MAAAGHIPENVIYQLPDKIAMEFQQIYFCLRVHEHNGLMQVLFDVSLSR